MLAAAPPVHPSVPPPILAPDPSPEARRPVTIDPSPRWIVVPGVDAHGQVIRGVRFKCLLAGNGLLTDCRSVGPRPAHVRHP